MPTSKRKNRLAKQAQQQARVNRQNRTNDIRRANGKPAIRNNPPKNERPPEPPRDLQEGNAKEEDDSGS